MPIEICQEFVERLAKREEELAEHGAQFPIALHEMGDAMPSPYRFSRSIHDARQD